MFLSKNSSGQGVLRLIGADGFSFFFPVVATPPCSRSTGSSTGRAAASSSQGGSAWATSHRTSMCGLWSMSLTTRSGLCTSWWAMRLPRAVTLWWAPAPRSSSKPLSTLSPHTTSRRLPVWFPQPLSTPYVPPHHSLPNHCYCYRNNSNIVGLFAILGSLVRGYGVKHFTHSSDFWELHQLSLTSSQ